MFFTNTSTYITICFLAFIPIICTSQNLVYNGSFEEYVSCPKHLGNFEADVVSWNTPTQGSTDYFNSCSLTMGAPENFNGKQDAFSGTGYAGFYLYAPQDYREYIQVPLKRTLQKGQEYDLSFKISLADDSDYAIKKFGVLLSNEEIKLDIKKELSKMHLYRMKQNTFYLLELNSNNYLKDMKSWTEVSTAFTATGKEQYLLIGNFFNNARTAKVKIKEGRKKGAYYYLDDVRLIQTNYKKSGELAAKDSTVVSTVFELDKTHVVNTILFDFDTYELLEDAKDDLDKIYHYLKTNVALKIRIEGHTDNVGNPRYNQILSDKRCFAVASYFMTLGLKEDRISWQGFGDRQPIRTNDTKEGRTTNRRVAFVISKSD